MWDVKKRVNALNVAYFFFFFAVVRGKYFFLYKYQSFSYLFRICRKNATFYFINSSKMTHFWCKCIKKQYKPHKTWAGFRYKHFPMRRKLNIEITKKIIRIPRVRKSCMRYCLVLNSASLKISERFPDDSDKKDIGNPVGGIWIDLCREKRHFSLILPESDWIFLTFLTFLIQLCQKSLTIRNS